MSTLNELVKKLKECKICANTFPNIVNIEEKPCLEFDVYCDLSEGIRALFIGESPPARKVYFYDCSGRSSLRKCLFELLEIKDESRGLKYFKQNYLLTDAIKCRVSKKKRRTIPRKVIKNCAKLLKSEINLLNVRKIVVLGSTALKALQYIGFKELKGYKVAKDCGKIVKSKDHSIFICVLPIPRNKRYLDETIRKKLMSFLGDEL